ncbi:MAG: CDP-alcohol phosphatidyltransferase family protein [Victivallaceae bacterium]|nr:CDP-alcohol phosphatidyltransferase family protein [Victivallaceae bacterium]
MKKRLRDILPLSRCLKWVPNSLTLCNSLCGFAAILCTLRVYERDTNQISVFIVSAAVICFAMVFDALDGFAARIFNAASMHGLQMDSLSDMVTFGVAPAALVAIMTHCLRDTPMNRPQELLVYVLCSIYLGCAALRLATYNVHAMLEKKGGESFHGLPTPGGAAAIAALVFFAGAHEVAVEKMALYLPFYAAVLGLLMVSPIPYTHMGKWLTSVHRNRKRGFALIAMLVIVAVFQVDGVAALVTLYIFSGPAMALWHLIRRPMVNNTAA